MTRSRYESVPHVAKGRRGRGPKTARQIAARKRGQLQSPSGTGLSARDQAKEDTWQAGFVADLLPLVQAMNRRTAEYAVIFAG